ncbi:MAG: prephenate dehydratase [Leptolyngbyaceae cyanobacterium bins.59]|nr:prephenate dehydratase [Leptolyngbyaceae cyanobacterium bins.59]
MSAVSIAHLGPTGTYAEAAAIACANWLKQETGQESYLCPYPSIGQTLQAVFQGEVKWGVVPVENSVEGSVTMTLDALWQLGNLQIQWALVLPISHALLSYALSLEQVQTVYSHPQALAQCQGWLQKHLPQAQLIPANSTTEALEHLQADPTLATVSSLRAAELYQLPILAHSINDYPDNCTRFWVLSQTPSPGGCYTSLAFSVRANVPGALVKPLQIFADRNINLSRIESRPTKRSLGDYLFFMDLEANTQEPLVQAALTELASYTETLKIFGSYSVLGL